MVQAGVKHKDIMELCSKIGWFYWQNVQRRAWVANIMERVATAS